MDESSCLLRRVCVCVYVFNTVYPYRNIEQQCIQRRPDVVCHCSDAATASNENAATCKSEKRRRDESHQKQGRKVKTRVSQRQRGALENEVVVDEWGGTSAGTAQWTVLEGHLAEM